MKCKKHKIEMHNPECSKCEGDGALEEDWDGLGGFEIVDCWQCEGTGVAKFKICQICQDEYEEGEL